MLAQPPIIPRAGADTSAVTVTSADAQLGHTGGVAGTATASLRRLGATMSSTANHIHVTLSLAARTVKPRLPALAPVSKALTNAAPLTSSDRLVTTPGVAAALQAATQTIDSAAQTVTGGAAPVARAGQVTQGATTVVAGAGATGQAAGETVEGSGTVAAGVITAVPSGVAGVVQSLGATGTSGPVGVPSG